MLPVNILLVLDTNIFPLLSPTQRGLGEEAHPELLAAGAGHVVDDVVPRVVGDVLDQQRPGPRSRLAPAHLYQGVIVTILVISNYKLELETNVHPNVRNHGECPY